MQLEKPVERLTMEKQKIQFGLSKHFSRTQWLSDQDYLRTKLREFEADLECHGQTVKTGFKNIIVFLKSICKKDSLQCEDDLESILKDDSTNINAFIGLYECTASRSKKNECKQAIDKIMKSDNKMRAISKALLEIGLALCLLIPKYQSDNNLVTQPQQTDSISDYLHNLEFTTPAPPMDNDLYTDFYIAQKARIYNALRYLQEGLSRFDEAQMETNITDQLIWKFFSCNDLQSIGLLHFLYTK